MQDFENGLGAAGPGTDTGIDTDPDEAHAPRLATRTFAALGTKVCVSAPMAADELDAVVETARRVFRDAEEDFGGGGRGLAGRLREGTLELRHAPARMRSFYGQAIRWRNALGSTLGTAGAAHAAGGPMDAGLLEVSALDAGLLDAGPLDAGLLVKGWAIAHTGQAMMDLELPHWAITAGGDVLCSGSPFPAQPSSGDPFYGTRWRAGITDPGRPSGLLADVPLAGTPGFTAALATSASSGSLAVGGFRQVSVLAEDILAADVLSRAILAGGQATLAAAVREFGVEVLVVGPDPNPGSIPLATAGWPTHQPTGSSAIQALPR